VSEWAYIGVAYGLTWAVLAAYAAYVVRRGRRAEAMLRELPPDGREMR
jgi:predicted MFS family arabinose efflux permease